MPNMVLTAMPRSTSAIDTRPKIYLVEVPRRVAFMDVDNNVNMDDETDNPFRPGSELSREADIIVNLIKEGKPITPTRDMDSANEMTNGSLSKQHRVETQSSPSPVGNSNGTPAKVEPGVVEVQHGIIVPPNDKLQVVEQVNLKKKRKCCTIQ